MVQLKSYYGLCPLIDRLSFIGVSEDKDQGCAIVTLGKNVVNLYKLSDQKHIGGWTSKEHITAPVIYDTVKKEYVGVFKERVIKTWERNIQSLDKLKKKKFSKAIWKIIKDNNGKGTIIFKDGDCSSLVYAIDERKALQPSNIISKDETLIEAALFNIQDQIYICYMLKSNNSEYVLLSYELNVEFNTPILESAMRIPITRDELPGGKVIGVTISAQADPPQAHVLWSDGRLFSNILREDKFNSVGHVPWICRSLDVNMVWIGGKHIAIYGADNGQEGAVLAVYNVLFGVGTCSHPLKLFCKGARLWCVWDYVLLEATQHLAVVPFILDTHRDMLGLLGSHKTDTDSSDVLIADWGKGKSNLKSKDPWNEMVIKGVSEREICSSHFPALIEENNMQSIKQSLDKFTDIPENIIVTLLSYVIKRLNPKSSLKDTEKKLSFELNVDNLELQSLLNTILSLPYVSENMTSTLRKLLSFNDMLYLIQYCNYNLSPESGNGDVNFESKLILWSTVLLDSHCQQLLLANDETAANILNNLEKTILEAIGHIQDAQGIVPLLDLFISGKDGNKSTLNESPINYFVEEISINGL